MVTGSIAVPGAVVMVNNDLSSAIQNRLMIQLFINEAITGEEFDIRLAADPDYVRNIRVLGMRLLVLRSFLDTTNRTAMDVVLYIKHNMASIASNCFGPPGKTYMVKDLTWPKLCIYNTEPDRTCAACGCGSCGCSSDGYDGYVDANGIPYYPAKYDPSYPYENHLYVYKYTNTGIFGNTYKSNDGTLCDTYYYRAGKTNFSGSGCRCVKK